MVGAMLKVVEELVWVLVQFHTVKNWPFPIEASSKRSVEPDGEAMYIENDSLPQFEC